MKTRTKFAAGPSWAAKDPKQRARELALSAIRCALGGIVNIRDHENAHTTDQQRAEWYDPLIAELEMIHEWVQAGFPNRSRVPKPKPKGGGKA